MSDWQKIKSVFHETLELPEEARERFLEQQPESVRIEVRDLISSHEHSEDFIKEPAVFEFGLDSESFSGMTIGEYKILRKIGAGGMGTVFLAEKEGLERRFAVKLIKRGMDTEDLLRRFEIEKQILARLEHPNIAALIDGGMTDDGRPFLVMEFINGISIIEYSNENQLDASERLKLFCDACSAVTYAHQNLVIHRDLKPSNILVTKEGVPKLLDFGIAKLLDPDGFENTATSMQAKLLTPEYASPEQLNGLPVTTASDVYSLGVVLYELLSGQRPFYSVSRNYREIVNLVLTTEPVKPSAISGFGSDNLKLRTNGNNRSRTSNNGQKKESGVRDLKSLRGDIDNIILKSLRKEPERRYQSVQEFAGDIRRQLSGLPVSATADTRRYRLSKFVERHRKAVAVAGLISLLLISFSGFSVYQGVVADRERKKAERRLNEIRKVAKLLINETNDSLNKIPGNLAVQKALAEKSVFLLDSLAKDETKDTGLLIELADAYTKLALIQNLSFREFETSANNLAKAKSIYHRALEKEPGNIEIRRGLFLVHMRFIEAFKYTSRRNDLFALSTEIIENQRAIIELDPTNANEIANLSAVYGAFADIDILFDKKEEAIRKFKRGNEIIDDAIRLQESQTESTQSLMRTAKLKYIKGWMLKGAGDTKNAIENFRSAVEIAKRVYLTGITDIHNFSRVMGSHEQIGDIFASNKDFTSAFESYTAAIDWANKGLKNKELSDPHIIRVQECGYFVKTGKMLQRSGRPVEAVKYFSDGETLCLENVKQTPDSKGTLLDQLEEFYEISDFNLVTGRSEKSIALLAEIAEIMEASLEENEWDFGLAFALAETFEKIGDCHQGEKARGFYEKSGSIWTKYNKTYPLLPAEIEKMASVKKKLRSV